MESARDKRTLSNAAPCARRRNRAIGINHRIGGAGGTGGKSGSMNQWMLLQTVVDVWAFGGGVSKVFSNRDLTGLRHDDSHGGS